MKIKAFPEQEKRIRFEDVYLSYFSKMKYFAKEYVISEEDAENIVQDVFVELWENKEMLNMHMNLIAYLFTTIKNKCLNHLRHKLVVQIGIAYKKLELNSKITFRYCCFSSLYKKSEKNNLFV